jgi:hypothetical protein
VLAPLQSGSTILEGGSGKFQLWTPLDYDPQSGLVEISNQVNGDLLYNPNSTASAHSTVYTTAESSGLGFHWTFVPDYALERILRQPAEPFPPLSAPVYDCINTQLGLSGVSCVLGGVPATGLRCEYENLTALSTYQAEITNQDGGVQENCGPMDGFAAVENQLIIELGDAAQIDMLYANITNAVNDTLMAVGMDTDQLISDAGVSMTEQVSVIGTTIGQGLIETALRTAGPAGGVFVSIMQIGLQVAAESGMVSGKPFQDAVDNVYADFCMVFMAILEGVAAQQTTILGDWGKMQAVTALINSSLPNSLFWPPDLHAQLVQSLPPRLETAFMAILLQARFQICTITYSSANSLPDTFVDIPSYAGFVEELDAAWDNPGNGLFNLYAMQEIGNCGDDIHPTYPGKAALQTDLFDKGVSPHDFFTGNNGWNIFAVTANPTDLIRAVDLASQGCDAMVSTIENQTATMLSYTVSNTHGYFLSANTSSGDGPLVGSIPPYGTLTIAALTGDGITDVYQMKSDTGQLVATFSLNMDNCQTRFKGQTPFINGITTSGGFAVKPFNITRGSFNSSPATIQVAIYDPTAPQ